MLPVLLKGFETSFFDNFTNFRKVLNLKGRHNCDAKIGAEAIQQNTNLKKRRIFHKNQIKRWKLKGSPAQKKEKLLIC
jgi:hypothetical protein